MEILPEVAGGACSGPLVDPLSEDSWIFWFRAAIFRDPALVLAPPMARLAASNPENFPTGAGAPVSVPKETGAVIIVPMPERNCCAEIVGAPGAVESTVSPSAGAEGQSSALS